MSQTSLKTEVPQEPSGSSQDQLQQSGGGGSGGSDNFGPSGGGQFTSNSGNFSGSAGGGSNFHDSKRGRGRGRGQRGGNKRGFFGNRNNGEPFRGGNKGPKPEVWKDNRQNGELPDAEEGHSRFQSGPMDKVAEKLASINGPTFDLPPVETDERKFSGRARLYVGNIAQDVSESDLKELFGKYGETGEIFLNREKNFAFLKMDYVNNADKAKRELDGFMVKGKNLKIRFAPSNSVVKVKNLSNYVSNELLYHAFSVFGEIERALVLVDDRGKPTGEGIVEFARRGAAMHAIRKCTERCFFLTSSLRPVIVESHEIVNDVDGYMERFLQKRHSDYIKEREAGPRFAENNSFEQEYGERWKQLIELFNEKEQALKKELQMEMDKLEAQMEYAKYEHETAMLRDQLRARELDRERQKQEWEMKERMVEEQRRRNEEEMRRKQESMQQRLLQQEEEMRRRKQENNLFMQAHQLNSMLDQQEQNYEQQRFDMKPDMQMQQQNNWGNAPNKFGGGGGPRSGGGGGGGGWMKDRRDDFQPKRRRF